MVAPTVMATVVGRTGSSQTTGPYNVTTASITPQPGETLVATAATESSSNPIGNVSDTSGQLTWTLRGSNTVASSCPTKLWTAVVPAGYTGGAVTVTVNITGNIVGGGVADVCVVRWGSVALPATPNVVTVVGSTTAMTSTINVAAGSGVSFLAADYNGVNGAAALVPAAATVLESYQYTTAGLMSVYDGGFVASTAGSYAFGVSAPAGQKPTLMAVELPVAATTVTDQPSGAEAGSPAGTAQAGTVRSDTPAGSEAGTPAETAIARPQGPVDQPTGAEQGAPAETTAAGAVRTDTATGAEQGAPSESPVANTATYDRPSGTEEGTPGETFAEGTVVHDAPSGAEPGQPGGVQVPLPPTLTLGELGPTELDLTLQAAPQVAEATLRFYGNLGPALRDGDAAQGYPLLRFCESGGRLLQNIEDLTRDAGAAPGWSTLFDITRAPTYALPWMGQTVGVTVDPTIHDGAQRDQIVRESGQNRGTVAALQQATRSFLQGATPTVDVIERDGNPWTVTVAIYASQLVGMSYAKLSESYPAYTDLTARYSTYQQYAVGFSELYQALAQVKPAGLLLNLYVRTGPSYASLSIADLTYIAAAAHYPTYAAEIGSQPVTS